jgi:hypothetical protein
MGQFVENLERDVLSDDAPNPSSAAAAAGTGSANGSEGATATTTAGPRIIDSRPAEPVDLFEVAGAPVTKRLVPIGVGLLVLFVVWRLLRRRS